MSANQCALFALLLYTLMNIAINKCFSHVEPLITLSIYCFTILILALLGIAIKWQQNIVMVMPERNTLIIIAACGICCFFADTSYFTAYHKGGTITAVTTIVALMPLLATIMESLVNLKLPGISQLSACMLATAAVCLATKK